MSVLDNYLRHSLKAPALLSCGDRERGGSDRNHITRAVVAEMVGEPLLAGIGLNTIFPSAGVPVGNVSGFPYGDLAFVAAGTCPEYCTAPDALNRCVVRLRVEIALVTDDRLLCTRPYFHAELSTALGVRAVDHRRQWKPQRQLSTHQGGLSATDGGTDWSYHSRTRSCCSIRLDIVAALG